MRGCIIRIEFNSTTIFFLSGYEVIVVVIGDLAKRGVCFGKFIVESERFQRRFLRFRHVLTGRLSRVDRNQRVRISKSRVCECILRVFLNGLLEKWNGLLDIKGSSLVPVETSLEVKLISFDVGRVLLLHARLVNT